MFTKHDLMEYLKLSGTNIGENAQSNNEVSENNSRENSLREHTQDENLQEKSPFNKDK